MQCSKKEIHDTEKLPEAGYHQMPGQLDNKLKKTKQDKKDVNDKLLRFRTTDLIFYPH